MFNRKKQLQKELKELEIKQQRLLDSLKTGDFLTAEVIQRIANFNANVVRTKMFASDNENESEINNELTALDYIRKWEIPPDDNWGWDYWVLLDQTTDYWIGRYSNFEGNEKYTKNAILTCLRIGIKFGMSGIEKATGIPYYVSVLSDGKYRCYSATEMLDYNNKPFQSIMDQKGNHKYTVSNNIQVVKDLKPDEIIIYTRRSTRIGDFMWYLKDLLTHIYNMYCINNAIVAVSPKILGLIDDPSNKAAIWNLKQLLNVCKPVKILIKNSPFTTGSDNKYNISGEFKLGETNNIIEAKATENMILIAKTHFEEFCNKNGIPITSSKQQSLSSDANLSTFTTQCRTVALDNHVEDFFKELGIKITIDEPEITPQNDNADKNGGGTANTEGDKING